MQDTYATLEPAPLKNIIDENDPMRITKALGLALRVNKQNAITALLKTGNVDFYTMMPDIKRTLLDCLVEVNNPEVDATVQPFCPPAVLALWAQKITAVSGNADGNLLGKTPLHLAAIVGNLAAIDEAIASNVPVNGRDRFGRTALFYAVCKGVPELVIKLICFKTDPNLHGIGDKSPLQMAIEAGNEKIATLLMGGNVDVNYFAPGTEPPLKMAITLGLSGIAVMLIMHRCAHNIPDKDGAYPLHLATLANLPIVVSALLFKGANVNACLANNITALHFAASENLEDVATALLANMATIDCLDINRRTPLHYAAETNAIDVMRLIVNAGTNINACDAFGDTALHIACGKGHFEAAQFLVQIGGDLDLLGRKNLTARQLAEEGGKASLIKLFNPAYKAPQVPNLALHSAVVSKSKPAAVNSKAHRHHEPDHDNGNRNHCVIF
jgi:ankyrin repeat protein